MTHDSRALELIASVRDDDDDAMALAYAHDALDALTAAGLRVVPVEPSEADVERVAIAVGDTYLGQPSIFFMVSDALRERLRSSARAAIRAFLNGGGDD